MSGVYAFFNGESRQVATIDDVLYGSQAVQRDVGSDLMSIIRDVATDQIADMDDLDGVTKIIIYVKS
jgi:hypothetical protein